MVSVLQYNTVILDLAGIAIWSSILGSFPFQMNLLFKVSAELWLDTRMQPISAQNIGLSSLLLERTSTLH